MRSGKISESMLKRSVLKEMRTKNRYVESGAGIGRDAAVFTGMEDGCVTSTTTVTLGEGHWGMLGITRVLNDIACLGGHMEGVMVNITMPEKYDEKVLKQIMRQTEEACSYYGVQLVGGHTEIFSAVNRPLISYTGIGRRVAVISGKVEPGQDIILTKWIGMEGAYLMTLDWHDKLRERFPEQMMEFSKNSWKWMSVAEEAQIAANAGATYMHNLSNGGILNALWELSVYAKTGLTVDFKKIPVRQEIIEFCEVLEVNPYRLLSGGALLITAPKECGLLEELHKQEIPAVIIGQLTDSNDKILVNEDEIRYLDVQGRDDLWSCIDGRKVI